MLGLQILMKIPFCVIKGHAEMEDHFTLECLKSEDSTKHLGGNIN